MCYLINYGTIHDLALIVRAVYLLSAVNTAGELHITFITVCVCVCVERVECVCV